MQLFKWLKLTKEERLDLKNLKKERKRFFKWLNQKRKNYLKFFKTWAPWDQFYIYEPIKMILHDMYEYYNKGDWVAGIPVITDENGEIIQKDTRAETLKTAIDLIQKYEALDEKADTMLDINKYNLIREESHKTLIEAFAYIADHMESWWD